jgi:protein-L-isoaspartate(D-aspartate) O-methyltransferase
LNNSWENLIQNLIRSGVLKTPRVIRAMKMVPRYLFLSENDKAIASIDAPLPIGSGQTVSAPLGWS